MIADRASGSRSLATTPTMGAKEATQGFARLRAAVEAKEEEARLLILDWINLLDAGQGWRSLKYATLAECVMAEMGYSQAHSYKLITQAKAVKTVISVDSHARESVPSGRMLNTLMSVSAEERDAIYKAAQDEGGIITADDIVRLSEVLHELPADLQVRVSKGHETRLLADAAKEDAADANAKAVKDAVRFAEKCLSALERYQPGDKKDAAVKNAARNAVLAARKACGLLV